MPHDAVAAALVAAGLVAGATVAWAARAPLEGLRTLLDFLLAAGLLRLMQADSWTPLALAALTIVVRQVAGRGLHAVRGFRDTPARRDGASASSAAP